MTVPGRVPPLPGRNVPARTIADAIDVTGDTEPDRREAVLRIREEYRAHVDAIDAARQPGSAR